MPKGGVGGVPVIFMFEEFTLAFDFHTKPCILCKYKGVVLLVAFFFK